MDARPYELPPAPILLALGTLVLARSETEESLQFVIADEFTQHAEAARALLAGLAFGTLVDRFEAVYRSRFPSPGGPEEIRSFCRELSELDRRRGVLIRTIWSQWDTGETQRANRPTTHAGGAEESNPVVSVTDIHGLAAEFDRASNRLMKYRSALRGPGTVIGRKAAVSPREVPA
jgi:hypothetical protein